MKVLRYINRNRAKIIFTMLFIINSFVQGTAQVDTAWLAQFNSSPNLVDFGRQISLDSEGNLFVCGHSFVNKKQEGVTTLLKYNSAGVEQWSRFTEPGVNMEDFEVDINNNLYISGEKENDMLLIKYDNDGNEIWRRLFNGGNGDASFAITTDNFGNIYQTGATWYQPQYNNFITIKYNSQGDTLWTRTYSSAGAASDYPKKVILDHSGNVYVTGFADNDIAILKYTPSGNLLWVRNINMNFDYSVLYSPDILVDKNDNLIVSGTQYSPISHSDILVAKFDSSGTQQWLRLWNGPANDSDVVSGNSIRDESLGVDGAGNIYVTGTTVRRGVYFSDNVVTLKYSPQGDQMWSHIYNGPANDWDRPYSIKVSTSGNVYVAGETVVILDSFIPLDYLTMKLNTNGQLEWIQTYDGLSNFADQIAAMTINEAEEVFVTGISDQEQNIFKGNSDIVTIKYTQTSTGITSNVITTGYSLSQNFPNPFNPVTKITFNIPRPGFVNLKVFDISGKEIALLINEVKSGGQHSVDFDATAFSSGTYFYRIETGDFTMTKRMMVIK